MRTSFVIIPTFIGEVKQDYLYWPLKYKALACQWRETTDLGHLFQSYQPEGYLS